jgi:predicted transcriptional regulator YdeE
VIGVAYPREDGFTLVLGAMVTSVANVPSGMTPVELPPLTCAFVAKSKEDSVQATYDSVHAFMNQEGLKRNIMYPVNIEIYSSVHRATSQQQFEMDSYLPIE